ncbi:MAG: GNAT family N-acetyltransferase [Caulobacteraceae bacterium]|nr:GNAT family N-acetyltransferase [Caulobacteraceae bacterium]
MPQLRPYRPEDLEALYHIALLTGDNGQDASAAYADPKMVGHIYAAPYAVLEPDLAFVVEDEAGVGGYIVGALDTYAFEQRLERDWWPGLRARYPEPEGAPDKAWSADALRAYQFHHPSRTPRRVAEPWPSHLHINLLPRLQGQGWGKALIDRWLAAVADKGSTGAHLGVGGPNARGVRFYQAYGFREFERLPPPWEVIWFVIDPRDAAGR